MIEARHLGKRFGRHTAIDDVSLRVEAGEVVGFLGPNGAGKTTTLRILAGVFPPSSGTATVDGHDVVQAPRAARRRLGYAPERPALYREMTVAGLLGFAAVLREVGAPRAAIGTVLERTGLAGMGRERIGALSKGYQQRVGIAQALIHEPEVIILDEPTVGLDPNQIREIRALIRSLGSEHSVILSTHILPEVEAICDRVQILHRGELVFSDSIGGLRQFRGGHSLQVALHRPPPAAELSAVAGGAEITQVNANAFRIKFENGKDPTEAIVRTSVERNWGLYQLQPAHASLEEVFVHLTRQEAEEGPGKEGASA